MSSAQQSSYIADSTHRFKMAIYHEVLFSLKPNVKIEDEAAPAGCVWIAFLRYVLSVPGCEKVCWRRVANTNDVRVVLVQRDNRVPDRFYVPGFTHGMKPMNGYLIRAFVHNVIQQPAIPDLSLMKEIMLNDLPEPKERPPRVSAGSLFGAAVNPQILQNRRKAIEGKQPLGVVMGQLMQFSEPWLENRARDEGTCTALDIFSLTLESHQIADLNNLQSPIGLAWFSLRRSLSKVPGFHSLYWGRQEECPNNVQIMILWNNANDQATFNSSRHRIELWGAMLPFLAQSARNVPIWSIPSLIGRFSAFGDILEILAFYLPESITEADHFAFEYYFKEFNSSFMGPYLSGGDVYPQYIFLGGWVDGRIPLGELTATVYVGFCNWISSYYEAQKCSGFPFRSGMMETEMVEAMAMMGVESRHILLNNVDTEKSLQRVILPMILKT